jgi:RNA polymerase sigma factor for flagellar operon FliA
MSREELERLFVANLPVVERILSALGRRGGMSSEEAEDFAAWAKLQLIEDDYAILAKFRGESSLATYLTVVLSMMLRGYRVKEWGRWRPSAVAKQRGTLAVRLETLVHRDGMTIAEAGQRLRTSGETTMSDRELGQLASHFPARLPLRPVVNIALPVDAPGSAKAEDVVEEEEAAQESAAAKRALDQALDSLPNEDRLIVRMHYMESMSIADIARGLSLPQKPLYRRLERALITLRGGLERAGISRDHVRELTAPP